MITHLERALAWTRDNTPDDKVRKLERALTRSAFPLPESVPLFAVLLSLPVPERYPPRPLTPQRQRQHTLEALLTCRPEFTAPWSAHAHLPQLTLSRLGRP